MQRYKKQPTWGKLFYQHHFAGPVVAGAYHIDALGQRGGKAVGGEYCLASTHHVEDLGLPARSQALYGDAAVTGG